MKVLAVSHAYVVDVNQELFAELAKFKDLEIAVVVPSVFTLVCEKSLSPLFYLILKERSIQSYPGFAGNNRLLSSKNMRLYLYPHWEKPVGEFKSDIIRIVEEISIEKELP